MKIELLNLDEWDFGGNKIIRETFENLNEQVKKFGEKTILLAEIGDFYELYSLKHEFEEDDQNCIGSPIISFSNICDLNITGKNSTIINLITKEKYKIRFAGFKSLYIDKYAEKLKSNNFTVVRFDQKTAGPQPERFISKVYSPISGDLDSNKLFSSEILSNSTSCIWLEFDEKKTFIIIGLSNIDVYTGKTTIFEYKINYSHSTETYDELQRSINIINPCEVIIISSLIDKELDELIKFLKITDKVAQRIIPQNSVRAKNCYKQTYQKKILEKFFVFDEFSVFIENFYNFNVATQSFCYLLDFIYEYNPNLVRKIKEPIFENNGNRVLLANHSLVQLNIIGDNKHKGKYSSIFNMMDECCTSMGKRQIYSSLVSPITDIEDLNLQYDIIDYLKSNIKFHSKITGHLKKIKDLQKFSRQIILGKIRPCVVTMIYEGLQNTQSIYEILKEDPLILNYLKKKKSLIEIDELKKFIDFLNNTFDIQKCKDIRTLGNFCQRIIKSGVNENLDTLLESHMESFDKLEAVRFFLDNSMNLYTKKKNEYVKFYDMPKKGKNLSITKTRSKILLDCIKSMEDKNILIPYKSSYDDCSKTFSLNLEDITFETHSANCIFIKCSSINKVLIDLNEIKTEVDELIEKIYLKSVKKIEKSYFKTLESVCDFITEVDFSFCKAQIALKFNYFRPEIIQSSSSFVSCKDLRHPLIECLNTDEFYVPNDIELNESGILLYGTNAVGKTSLIRAIGIAVIMAQAGFFVASSNFKYFPYKKIFTRIVGNDNLFENSSSFAVEIIELKTILRLSDKNALVLGDELAKSTELESAESISTAGFIELSELNASYIFATHLHSLAKFDEIKNLVKTEKLFIKHMTVVYNKETGKLMYDRKLIDGSGPGIYGIECCKSLGLTNKFIETANKIRLKYHPETSSILEKKVSKYSSNKIREMCEICKENMSSETHHIYKQCTADENGFITTQDGKIFHKNHPANLMCLCEECHLNQHKNEDK